MKAEKYTLRAYGGEYGELMGEMDTSDDDDQVEFFITHHRALGNEVHVYGLIQLHFAPGQVYSTPQPVKREYAAAWYGKVSLHQLLIDIGGWHVGCENAIEAAMAVEYVLNSGWVNYRTHYARAYPKGVEAYEITDSGLAMLEKWGSDVPAIVKKREWYRVNSSKPEQGR